MNDKIQKPLIHRKIFCVFFISLFLLPAVALSATAEDYAPLLGTQWSFTFQIGSEVFQDTITFASAPYESGGDWYLSCTSSFYNPSSGVASYSTSTSEYALLFYFYFDADYWAYYGISISGDAASGTHAWLDYDMTVYAMGPYSTTGTRVDLTADFTAAPLTGDAPLTVNFTDQSVGPATAWQWDFGDGGTGTQQNPTHAYTTAGTYSVTLTVTNSYTSDTVTKNDLITVTEAGDGPITVDFGACPPAGKAPLAVQFSNKSIGSATAWQWDFGDGGTSTEQNPSHTYTATGTYTVVLTATNDSGTYSNTKTGFIRVSNEIYRFERMWPNLQQPWYFAYVRHLARDRDGNIYVVNGGKDRVVKLTADGQFITNFGEGGNGDGQFQQPYGVAVDDQGYVYVTDLGRKDDNTYDETAWRVQKFDGSGNFVASWRNVTGDSDQLDKPTGISVDWEGNILVADSGHQRIVKYTPAGTFIAQLDGYDTEAFVWPTDVKSDNQGAVYVVDQYGNKLHKFNAFSKESYDRFWDAGETGATFNMPTAVDLDGQGNLYVTDYAYHANNRVVKIDANGQATVLIDNGLGSGENQFWGPFGVTIDPAGYLYVGAYWGGSVSKFTLSGEFLNKWSSASDRTGFFSLPHAIAVDPAGNIYVADSANYRIQKIHVSDGSITFWGSKGTGDGQFEGDPDAHQGPHAIAIHPNTNVYVADTLNHRVQIFNSNGNYLDQIGGLTYPSGLAIDAAGNIYVAEWSGSHQIKKFDVDGTQLAVWGGPGSGDGQFNNPHGIAIDAQGHVYVADADNNRIQIFDANGNFVGKWGTPGQDAGQLNQPWDVAIDGDGQVLVADTYNNRIQRFTPSGCFLESLGSFGSLPEQLYQPQGLALGPDGALFVVETSNNRVQKFKRALLDNSKAVILAGGGPYRGNYLWDATRVNANFAYLALTYQGFTKDTIYYLTPEAGLDLDNNGLSDDVDGDATIANLQAAITTWAADATNLIVYLVDHGGERSFRVNEHETLSADELKGWVDALQAVIPGKAVVIFDACESGSFLPAMTPPESKERIVVSSASATESAYFVSQGAISFSKYFWSHIYKGSHIQAAFNAARDAISTAVGSQHPLLDDNGDGSGNEGDGALAAGTSIGNGTVIQEDVPVIGGVSAQPVAGTATVQLNADNVTDSGGISRVWAVITPPDYNPAATDNTIHELPYCDLQPTGNDNFEAVCEGFSFAGTYPLDFYAMDRVGNTSAPSRTSVTVSNPPTRRAIIVAAGAMSDPSWPAVAQNAGFAYRALKFQGYPDDNIYFLSPDSSDPQADALPTLSALDNAINNWASSNTQDLLLYLVGEGAPGVLRINASETLSAASLDAWLDSLQGVVPGKVAVVYDGSGSGSFLSALTPPAEKERILIASTLGSQSTAFSTDGSASFSMFFWERVFMGINVWDAFSYARTAIEGGAQNQTPLLDDDGNGTPNQASDGKIARTYTVGMGIRLSGNEPRSGATVADLTLNGETSAEIWIDNVSATKGLDRVYAVITSPAATPSLPGLPPPDQSTLDLSDNGSGRYTGTYTGFNTYGTYIVCIYVKDVEGNLSTPKKITIFQTVGPDVFEADDSPAQAGVIVVNAEDAQRHNFHDAGDPDWMMFYGIAGNSYDFKTKNIGPNSQTTITLYDSDGATVIGTIQNTEYTEGDLKTWLQCPADGIYYVKVAQLNPAVFGPDTAYDVSVIHPVAGTPGMLVGRVVDSAGAGIKDAIITAESVNIKAISLPDGYYMMVLPTGTYRITVAVSGYTPVSQDNVVIQTENHASLSFEISTSLTSLKGDLNGDQNVDLADAILVLQVLVRAEAAATADKQADVNGDGKIGPAEVIYIFQKIAGLR